MEVKIDIVDEFLCSTCLCVGRQLSTITDHRLMKYYHNTIKEIPLNMPASVPNICWECAALLKRCFAFAEQVKDSFRILQTYSNEILRDRLLTDVTRAPRLKSTSVHQLSIPPSIEIQVDDEPVQSVFVKDESAWGVKEEERISDYESFEYLDTSEDATLSTIQEQRKSTKIKKFRKTTRKKGKRKAKKESKTFDDIKESTKILYQENEGAVNNIEKTEMQTDSKPEKTKKKNKKNVRTIMLTPEEVAAERSGALLSPPYVEAEIKCENCILPFKDRVLYELHLKTAHDENLGNYKCTICNSVFATEEALMIDYKKHTKRYECGECGKRALDKKSINHHYDEIHLGLLLEYTCEFCGKISNSLNSHKYHRATHRARLPCLRCDKTFRHRVGLANHTLSVHKEQNKFPCEICGKVLKWKSSLKKHMETHETKRNLQSGPYCQACDVSFTSLCSLKRHLRSSLKHVSSDQFKFICDHCNKKFSNKTKLRDHIEEKHLYRKYQCSICLKPSKNRVTLEQHTRNVHRPRACHKMCHLCGKGFPTQLQLDSHIRSHTGEKPFICEFCPSTFSQHGNLYKHYRQVHQHTPKKISLKADVETRAAPDQDAAVTYLKQVVFQFNTM